MKIRVSAVVVCGNDFALVHRDRNGRDSWTLPGGNVDQNEDIESAIIRELEEELGLNRVRPRLLFLQDMLIHRKGIQGIYRKLHLVFSIKISEEVKRTLKTIEEDDLEPGEVCWISRDLSPELQIYPGIGPYLASVKDFSDDLIPTILPPLTDKNYTWL